MSDRPHADAGDCDPPDDLNCRHAVAFAGGGSGGHLFPAIAVAEELLQHHPDCPLTFFVSERPLDRQIIDEFRQTVMRSRPTPADIVFCSLKAATGRLMAARPWACFPEVFRAFLAARRMLRERRVTVIAGTGGFASVAPVLAARSLRIPIVLLEPNAVPGKASRFLSRFAAVTCTGLPMLTRYAERWPTPLTSTGVPVRRQFTQMAHESRHPKALQVPDSLQATAELQPHGENQGRMLLILGGSQGSSRLNQLVTSVLRDDRAVPFFWRIVHQSGPHDVAMVQEKYERAGRSAVVTPFLEDLPRQLAAASVVVSRAGAVTLAEIACADKPAILLPLSTAADDHQLENARCFANNRAGTWIDERATDAVERLAAALTHLISQPHRPATEQPPTSVARCASAAAGAATVILRQSLSAGFAGRGML